MRPVLVVDDVHTRGGRRRGGGQPLTSAEAQTLQRAHARRRHRVGRATSSRTCRASPSGAKSGTAQFGTEDPPRNHAWMIAVQGDLAVSVFVEEGDFGSTTAGPLLEAFLRGVAA